MTISEHKKYKKSYTESKISQLSQKAASLLGAPRAVGGETSFHTLLAAFRSRNCGGAYPRALCRHPAPVPASGTPGAVPAARRAWHHCSWSCPPPVERSCPLGLSHTPMTPQSAALMVVTSGRSMAAPLSTHWRLQRVAPACSASPCRAKPWPHTRPGSRTCYRGRRRRL